MANLTSILIDNIGYQHTNKNIVKCNKIDLNKFKGVELAKLD